MKTRYVEQYENDTTPSADRVKLYREYREAILDEEPHVSLALVHYRGGDEEFTLARKYCESSDPLDRSTGADILAQLGWNDRTFLNESVQILISLLDDSDDGVVHSAAIGLGHRCDASAIPALLRFVGHENSLVRYGVVFGLSRLEDPRAIAALITLASDSDRDVRNWAVFGLGSQIDADSSEIRQALRRALSDSDHEIRGEALVGLARRKDSAIIPELFNEWRDDHVSILSIEAAEETKDPRLFNRLNQFTKILRLDEAPHFAKTLADAIAACKPKTG